MKNEYCSHFWENGERFLGLRFSTTHGHLESQLHIIGAPIIEQVKEEVSRRDIFEVRTPRILFIKRMLPTLIVLAKFIDFMFHTTFIVPNIEGCIAH